MHETFDHTADLGLRVRAVDLKTLFAEAGQALMAAVVENPEAIRDVESVEVVLPGDDLDYLLFDWLRALLYQFEAKRLLFGRFEIDRVDAESGLQARAWGERMDESRHEPAHEVKAITYHDLRVEQLPNQQGWLAEVIVDI